MKVGIVTITDIDNYGNRLQNYALQTVLNRLNVETETLKNDYNTNNYGNILKRIYKMNLVKLKKYIKSNKKRRHLFVKFNKNIKFNNKLVLPESNIDDKYDYFIVGSDQVWKPTYGRMSDVEFLSFSKKQKKISYAASFGISELPINKIEKARNGLSSFKNISVREDAGKKIVEDLTGRNDVEVLLDPTMLLDVNDWNKVIDKPKQYKGNKFILCYFLGELSSSRKNAIENIAKEKGLETIYILDKKSKWYETGPSEFLFLEKNAELICTDSFHSCVFSIIFNRPFIVFKREGKGPDMNSRIETLLEKFKLEDRVFEDIIEERLFINDYTEAYKVLDVEREKSKKFLEKALDLGENNEK